MTRKEVLTTIEQNRGKDLFLITEEPLARENKLNGRMMQLLCLERVSKTTVLRNAKRICSIRHSTYRMEGLDDVEGCNWYDEIVIFDTRKNPPSPQGGKKLLLAA